MAQENREAYIAWLREKLEDYCNDDGSYEVYWNYDDSITPDQLVEAVDNWKSEGYTSPESYLASTLYDTVGEAQENQLYVSILDDLNDAPDEVRACWDESTGIWEIHPRSSGKRCRGSGASHGRSPVPDPRRPAPADSAAGSPS